MKARLTIAVKNVFAVIVLACVPFSGALADEPPANVQLTIERVSDTFGILTATGSLPSTVSVIPGNGHILSIDNPFGAPPTSFSNGSAFVSSTLSIGSSPLSFAYEMGAGYDGLANGHPFLYIGADFLSGPLTPGATFNSGAMSIQLVDGGTFAAIGTSGQVIWGLGNSPFANLVTVGSWNVVGAVPEPETYAMMLAGLGLLGFTARRRKQKNPA